MNLNKLNQKIFSSNGKKSKHLVWENRHVAEMNLQTCNTSVFLNMKVSVGQCIYF